MSNYGHRFARLALLLFVIGESCAAARGATVTTADDKSITAPLIALEEGAVVLNLTTDGKSERKRISLEDIITVVIDPAMDAPPAPPDAAGAQVENPVATSSPPRGDFIRLFDGQTLANWQSDADVWSIQDGAITGVITESQATDATTYLVCSRDSFDNFELHYRFRIVGGLRNSSGVMFRSQVAKIEGKQDLIGYQQDLGGQRGLTGSLVDSSAIAGKHAFKAGPGERVIISGDAGPQTAKLERSPEQLSAVVKENDWNEATLIAQGNRIVSVINGQVFADATNERPGALTTGLIAIQLSQHRPMTVQFKEIKLRKLAHGEKPVVPGFDWDRPPAATSVVNPVQSPQPTRAPASPSTQSVATWQIRLANGDQITGVVSAWDEKSIVVRSDFGALSIPTSRIRDLWLGSTEEIAKARAAAGPEDRIKADATEDVAFARKDDQIIPVNGVALGMEGGALQFRFRDQQRRILLDKLVGVTFAAANDAAPSETLQQTLVLNGGDVITGNWSGLEKGSAILNTPWGSSVAVPVKNIERIRTRNGRLVYVSDLAPAHVEQTPFFDRVMPFRVDRSLTGAGIRLSDGDYLHGISVHSRTVLRYDIGGRYAIFRTKVGFQQPQGKLGRAVVRVLGDEKVLHEIPDARGDAPPIELDLPVTGINRLTLEVDFGADQDVGDRVVWADARLVRLGRAAK